MQLYTVYNFSQTKNSIFTKLEEGQEIFLKDFSLSIRILLNITRNKIRIFENGISPSIMNMIHSFYSLNIFDKVEITHIAVPLKVIWFGK